VAASVPSAMPLVGLLPVIASSSCRSTAGGWLAELPFWDLSREGGRLVQRRGAVRRRRSWSFSCWEGWRAWPRPPRWSWKAEIGERWWSERRSFVGRP
jgi:hypothetical protein